MSASLSGRAEPACCFLLSFNGRSFVNCAGRAKNLFFAHPKAVLTPLRLLVAFLC